MLLYAYIIVYMLQYPNMIFVSLIYHTPITSLDLYVNMMQWFKVRLFNVVQGKQKKLEYMVKSNFLSNMAAYEELTTDSCLMPLQCLLFPLSGSSIFNQ